MVPLQPPVHMKTLGITAKVRFCLITQRLKLNIFYANEQGTIVNACPDVGGDWMSND